MKVTILGWLIMSLSFLAGFFLSAIFSARKISDLEELIRYQRDLLKK